MRTDTKRGPAAWLASTLFIPALFVPAMAFAQAPAAEPAPPVAAEAADEAVEEATPRPRGWHGEGHRKGRGHDGDGECRGKKDRDCRGKHDESCDHGPDGDHFERIETMRMWGLTRQLDLTEDETARLFPMLSRNGKERREIFEGLQQSRRKLRDLMREEGGDVEVMKSEIDEVFALEQRMLDLRRSEFVEVEKLLGAERAVRFAAFDHKFRKRVHDLVRKHRGDRPGRNAPPPTP